MARDISELGADVFDDTPQPKRRISVKKRNYIIGLSITGLLLTGAIVGSVVAINTVLLDYDNIANITYYYTPASMVPDGGEPTAVLYKLRSDVKYPSSFRIPSQIKGYKVVGVADSAFSGHDEIKKVIMPSTLEFIGEKAFENCTNLATFTWSKNLADVGVDAFLNTKFYNNLLSDTEGFFDLPSGLLIYAGKDRFAPNTALFSDEISDAEMNAAKSKYGVTTSYRFGELGVKNICSGAFKGNDKIVYIDLPSQLDEIADSTFENCINLKGIDSNHCKLTEIGARAFANCEKLSDIKLPDNLTRLGDFAFSNTALTDTIPDVSHVESLGESIFAYCEQLTSVVFEGNYLPNYTFAGCSSLTSIEWGEGNSNINNVTSIGIGAFTRTGFTSFIVPREVKIINDETFLDCAQLEKVSLWGNFNYKLAEIEPEEDEDEEDEDVEDIITDSFIKYDGTRGSGTLDGVNAIKASAFNGCVSLNTIELLNDDYTVNPNYSEEGTFYFPASLIRTDGNSTISGTDNHVFSYSNVECVKITPNQRNIGSYAFFNNTSLKRVDIVYPQLSELNTVKANAFQNCSALEEFDLPASLKTLGASAFRGCSSLTNIGLGDTKITGINSGVFYGCESLLELDIPNTVSAIKTDAFYKNYSLNYLVLPSSLTEIQNNSFKNCRPDGEEPLKLFLSFTIDGFKKSVNSAKVWHDDTAEVYFLLGEGEEKNPEYNYWNGDSDNPQAI